MADRKVTIRIGAKDSASAVFGKVALNVSKLSRQISRLGQRAGRSLSNVGRSVSGLGKNMLLMGGAAAAGLGYATRTFANFDSKMAEVQAITGQTGEAMGVLRDKAKELGSSTRFSAAEAAEGMKFLGMAGFNTQQILAGIGPTLALAAAGGVELGEAADIASDVSSAFGLSADEIGRVADVIAKTATSANTDVLMMGETFKHVAPLAKGAGQTIEEASAAIGLLANSGIKASKAGTDMKFMLKAFTEQRGKIEAMGVATLDAEGNIRPMLDVMQELGVVIKDMPTGEKMSKLTNIFGRASAGAVILADSGGEAIEELRGKMENSEGAAQRMADTMSGSLGGVAIALKSAFEGLQIAVIEAIEGPLKSTVQTLTQIVSQTTKWVNANKQAVVGIVIAVGVLAGFGTALITAGTAATIAGFAITTLAGAVGTLGTVIAAMTGPVLGPLIAAAAVLLGLFTAMAGSFLITAYNTGLLGDAWVHLKDALANAFDTFKTTFRGIVDAMKSGEWKLAAQVGWAGVKLAFWQGLQDIIRAFALMFPRIWITVKDFLANWIEKTKNAAKAVIEIIANPSMASLRFGKSAIEKLLEFKQSGSSGGIAKFVADQKDAAEKELSELTKLAAQKAKETTAALTGGGGTSGGSSSSPTAGLAEAMAQTPGDLMAKTSAMAASIASTLTPTAAAAVTGASWSPTYADPLGKIGVTTVNGGPKEFGPADALAATESRLLSRGSGNSPSLEESKKQTAIQEKSLEKLNLISENFTNTPNPMDGVDFQFSGMA